MNQRSKKSMLKRDFEGTGNDPNPNWPVYLSVINSRTRRIE